MCMATYTIENYNALIEAISQGAQSVTYGDKTVNYRSLDDMLKLKALMEQDLGINTNKTTRIYPKLSKGL